MANITNGLEGPGTLGDVILEVQQTSLTRLGSFAAAALTRTVDRPLGKARQRDLPPLPTLVVSAEDVSKTVPP